MRGVGWLVKAFLRSEILKVRPEDREAARPVRSWGNSVLAEGSACAETWKQESIWSGGEAVLLDSSRSGKQHQAGSGSRWTGPCGPGVCLGRWEVEGSVGSGRALWLVDGVDVGRLSGRLPQPAG